MYHLGYCVYILLESGSLFVTLGSSFPNHCLRFLINYHPSWERDVILLGKHQRFTLLPHHCPRKGRSSHGLLMALWYSTWVSPFPLPLSLLSDRHMFQQPLLNTSTQTSRCIYFPSALMSLDKYGTNWDSPFSSDLEPSLNLLFLCRSTEGVKKTVPSVIQVQTSKPATETHLSNSKQV